MFRAIVISCIITATFFQIASAEIVNIGIYHKHKITSFVFHPEEGSYSVFTEQGKLIDIDKSDILELKYVNNQVTIKSLDKDYGTFKKVRFIGTSWNNSFKIKTSKSKRIKVYEDNLFVNLHSYYNYFQLINNIEIDNYVAGVVESEVGRSPPPEYFKLQAIICRTYALRNIERHKAEGFSLCDKVHCQAYNRKPKSVLIKEAATGTTDIVIVDSDINLITATFYSNCGGETAESEEVWRQKLYYLRTVKDTFCLHENNAVWEKKVPLTKWTNYLINHGFPKGSLKHECAIEYFQNCREQFFENQNVQIPFTKIRTDFHLKSAQFDVIPSGNFVILKGKGFGHGVGLCQEGAMKMAKTGYSYIDILHFYYEDVHMINLASLAFFKADY
ncbi:MAG: SpoIID/LytB domain-containing protein [Flavobacteriales bacterium]|nr:SpoIID/LytB domain-containing protein [Flavobacteriales bacterium]